MAAIPIATTPATVRRAPTETERTAGHRALMVMVRQDVRRAISVRRALPAVTIHFRRVQARVRSGTPPTRATALIVRRPMALPAAHSVRVPVPAVVSAEADVVPEGAGKNGWCGN